MVFNSCDTDTMDFSSKGCQVLSLKYTDSTCSSRGFLGDVCTACGDAATSEATGAAFTAISKTLALFGMQRRMYTIADSPSFKLMLLY